MSENIKIAILKNGPFSKVLKISKTILQNFLIPKFFDFEFFEKLRT